MIGRQRGQLPPPTLEKIASERLAQLIEERDEALYKLAFAEAAMKTYHVRDKAETVLRLAMQSKGAPERLHAYTVTDFLDKRAELEARGLDKLAMDENFLQFEQGADVRFSLADDDQQQIARPGDKLAGIIDRMLYEQA